jgi:hypothetical protein
MRHEIPERHQRVVRALRSGGPAVPATLRLPRVDAAPARRTWSSPALVAVAGAALVAVVLALATMSGGGPEVRELTAMSQQPATQPTPASNGALLERRFEGVAFPDWSAEFGWMADGARADTVSGRPVQTVFYAHHGHRIAYSVVSGEPLEPPADAETLRVDGVDLHRFRDGPRTVVTFERNGHTCVLAGHVIHPDTLVELASWQADGAVRF